MRIGIIAALHESNTFSSQPTTLEKFQADLLVEGDDVRSAMEGKQHEVSGFLDVLGSAQVEIVPIVAARAVPSGTITDDAADEITTRMIRGIKEQMPLDGILFAAHGAAVSESERDLDGFWIRRIRETIDDLPFVVTLDAHANLSPRMVEHCNAIIGYRSNPHLDQRQRGRDAAQLLLKTVRGEVQPTMAATFPRVAISIQKQCTTDAHLLPIYDVADHQLAQANVLANSILLGFPYADVEEMGTATIVVTDANHALAQELSDTLATAIWDRRREMVGGLISVDEALEQASNLPGPIGLLDMGDNVGGGSAADGTEVVEAIMRHRMANAFACIYDPDSVRACQAAGCGKRVRITVGGKTDHLHGRPLDLEVHTHSFHDGRFTETKVRHGGISEFDQGATAIVATEPDLTLMLTSRRMVPFSLNQLTSCGLSPKSFELLVIKGVNAPIAAYREVCQNFIKVNTRGSTCADMTTFEFQNRRSNLFPFEEIAKKW